MPTPSPDNPKYDLLAAIIDYKQGKLDDAGIRVLFGELWEVGLDHAFRQALEPTAQAILDSGDLTLTASDTPDPPSPDKEVL